MRKTNKKDLGILQIGVNYISQCKALAKELMIGSNYSASPMKARQKEELCTKLHNKTNI